MTTTQDIRPTVDWPEVATEEGLVRETQRMPSVHVTAVATGQMATANGVAPERARRITVTPSASPERQSPAGDPGTEPVPARTRAGRIASRFLRAALYVGTLPFKGVRALYWAIDTDAKVRSQGTRTVGRVEMTKTDTHVSEDPETGRETTTYTHYVSYSFPADGTTRRDQKKVGSFGSLSRGSAIRVYFLPNGNRVDSALDWNPRALR